MASSFVLPLKIEAVLPAVTNLISSVGPTTPPLLSLLDYRETFDCNSILFHISNKLFSRSPVSHNDFIFFQFNHTNYYSFDQAF